MHRHHPVVRLRWDGEHGVAVHGNTTNKVVSPLTIAGVEFEQIDLSIVIDAANTEHTYCWVMEPGNASGRPGSEDETAEMVRRLQEMAAAANHALRRQHNLPDRLAEYFQGIWHALLRFPSNR